MTDELDAFSGDTSDWHNVAMLMHEMYGYGYADRWWLYAAGYKEAADRLVAGIDAGQGRQDLMVYPILYLYRHYLEVMLKEQIRDAQRHLGIERPSHPDRKNRQQMAMAARGHDLAALWEYLLSLVYQLHPRQDPNLMEKAARVIDAFANRDHGGDAFRYPETLFGKPTLTDLKEINLRRLKDHLTLAESALLQIEGILNYKDELNQMAYDALGLQPADV